MSPEYEIRTIADFLAVPEKSIDACLADFKAWLELARKPKEINAAINAILDVPAAASFMNTIFTWRDDGVSGITFFDLVDPSHPDDKVRISIEISD